MTTDSLNHCPKCGGPADNGHDRCLPPNPYWCVQCMKDNNLYPEDYQSEISVVDETTIAAIVADAIREARLVGVTNYHHHADLVAKAILPYLATREPINTDANYWKTRYLLLKAKTPEPVSVDLQEAVRVLWNRQHAKGLGDYDAFKAKYPNDCKAHSALSRETAEICAKVWGLKYAD